MPSVKERKVYFSSKFVEVLIHSYLAPRQIGMTEGYHRGERACDKAGQAEASSCEVASSKKEEKCDDSNPLSVPYILTRLPELRVDSTHTQCGAILILALYH